VLRAGVIVDWFPLKNPITPPVGPWQNMTSIPLEPVQKIPPVMPLRTASALIQHSIVNSFGIAPFASTLLFGSAILARPCVELYISTDIGDSDGPGAALVGAMSSSSMKPITRSSGGGAARA
jgi:hypothetical protein